MADLPLKQLVLYKSGIGYFVREGKLDSDTLQLEFNKDEVNDVLKSLSVFDYAGGQVLGIHYDTPIDAEVKLAKSSIRLSEAESLKTLLRDLRGREIQAEFEIKKDKHETIIGQLVGIDVEETLTRLSILQVGKQIRVYSLDELRQLRILDEQSQVDLDNFLDSNKSKSDHRTIYVQLSEGEHDLNISYVAPSPNWRVSYRVIAESDANENQGKAILLGWGLFDNHIEDLEDVHITLVAGNPISFQYDLYSSNIPERERVKDKFLINKPVEYKATAPNEVVNRADYDDVSGNYSGREWNPEMRSESKSFLSKAGSVFGRNKQSRSRRSGTFKALRQSVELPYEINSLQAVIDGKHLAEMFQYIVAQPVSVKRGVSALVPIINRSNMSYTRELLYNYKKGEDHPVAALRMKNTTGFILEYGPVTVVENGDYKGEAIVPFTREDGELYLPYAVERGITIRRQLEFFGEQVGSYIQGIELVDEFHKYQQYTYTVENNTNQSKTVRIEHSKEESYDLFETLDPEEESAEFYRWSVTVEANQSIEFAVKVRHLISRTQIIMGGCNPFRRIVARILPLFKPELRRHNTVNF